MILGYTSTYVNKMIIGFHSDLAWEKLNVSQTPVSLIDGPCGGLPTWFADWKDLAWGVRGNVHPWTRIWACWSDIAARTLLKLHPNNQRPSKDLTMLNHYQGTPSNLVSMPKQFECICWSSPDFQGRIHAMITVGDCLQLAKRPKNKTPSNKRLKS